MLSIKKQIPNLFTAANLFCGCLSLYFTLHALDLRYAVYFIFAAGVFDFFDGFVARALKVHSEIGKQLDSLADVVSFGVAPAFIMVKLLYTSFNKHRFFDNEVLVFLPFFGLLIAVASAFRLAKFNIDTRQSDSFIGVPTPANAFLIASFVLIPGSLGWMYALVNNPYFLLIITLLMSYLMLCELPLFALKFKNYSWTDNKIRYIFLALSLTLLIVLQFAAIPFIVFLYVLLSLAAKRS